MEETESISNSFTVKDSRSSTLGVSVLSLAMFIILTVSIGKDDSNQIPFYLIGTFFLITFIVSFIHFLRPRIRLRIDKDGIWTKKSGLAQWNSIHYFYTTSPSSRGIMFVFRIDTRDRPFRIDLWGSDYGGILRFNFSAILREKINHFNTSNLVIDEGEHD